MKRIQKTAIVFFIVLVQCLLAVLAGVFSNYTFSGSKLPAGAMAGDVTVGNLERADAVKMLNERYGKLFRNGKLTIAVKDGEPFSIPYSEIDAAVDAEATIDRIAGNRTVSLVTALEKTFRFGKLSVSPAIRLDEGKLRKRLMDLASRVDRQPVGAVLYYERGKIVKKAEQDGQKLDIDRAVKAIREHLMSRPDKVLTFSRYENRELLTVQPDLKLRDLEEIDTILSEYSTKLIYPEFNDAISKSAGAINGVVLTPLSGGNAGTSTISFVQWLKDNDADFENDNEGYDQVASTLYAAVLKAGIDKDSITRVAHRIPVDYIEPGLDAWISGDGGELRFSNTLAHRIAIFAAIEEDRLIVRLAGSSGDKPAAADLKVEITGRFPPPVLNVENKSLKKGEKMMLDPGKEGLAVNVYRGTELISSDKFDAVKAIRQIGPGTDWEDSQEDK